MIQIKKEHLDVRVCDIYNYGDNEETLREYIQDSEKTFYFTPKDLDKMSDEELREYVGLMDLHWNSYMSISQAIDTTEIYKEVLLSDE